MIMSVPTFFINEIFETIQGEAHWTGAPAVFVRLQGCDVGCAWCDTKHTWERLPTAEISIESLLKKSDDAPSFARLSVQELVAQIQTFHAKHVVITGGEPAMYDLTALTERLVALGFRVQLETSGVYPIRVVPQVWVTLSPKLNMSGGKEVLPQAVFRANEIKLPVGKMRDYEQFCHWISQHQLNQALANIDVWLQPLSQSLSATELCQKLAILNGHRVSIQVHKYLGIR